MVSCTTSLTQAVVGLRNLYSGLVRFLMVGEFTQNREFQVYKAGRGQGLSIADSSQSFVPFSLSITHQNRQVCCRPQTQIG